MSTSLVPRVFLGAVIVSVAVTATLVGASPASADHNRLEQLSTGPNGGNAALPAEFKAASADGTRVFFVTEESLVSADTDIFPDVYQRSGTQTTLVSTGPTDANRGFRADFGAASADGTRVFF
jgi:hypothetical protein